jgi:hypothetical protein
MPQILLDNDSDAGLNIAIKTTFDGAGAKAAADSMAAIPENLQGLKKVGAGMEEIGEKTHISNRELRVLTSQLGHGIPGAAELMRAGVEKGAGGVFLLIAGIEMLRSAVEKINKENEESAAIGKELESTDQDRAKGIDKVRDALEKADVADAEFQHNFARDTQNAIDKAERLAQAILKTAIAADDGTASKRKSIAESEIDSMERRGVLSHAAALKAKEDLDIAFDEAKTLRMMAQDAIEMRLLQQQAYAKHIAVENGEKDEAAAAEKYKVAVQGKVENEDRMQRGQDEISRGTKAVGDLEKTGVTDESIQKLKAAFNFLTAGNEMQAVFKKMEGSEAGTAKLAEMSDFMTKISEPGFIGSGIFSMLPKSLQDAIGEHTGDVGAGFAALKQMGSSAAAYENLSNYENAQATIAGGKLDVANARKNQADVDINEGNAKSDLEAARTALQKSRDDVKSLQDKITEMSATNVVKETGARQDLGLDKANASLVQDRATAENLGGASDADKKKLIADASKIAGHTVDLQTAAQIIENGANNIGLFMNQVSRLTSALSQFTPAQAAELQRQVDELWKASNRNSSNTDLH